ncbi:DUF742 domain-containing protein [Streptosporangium longisporum]|uniref:DUF742 domain-containing protein n=1 Tax=Streptosporangium longisporum TaxID=46187 RepID=A0ABN3XUA9_9ACTN
MTGERRFDREAGPVVRPYTMTRGRTRSSGAPFDLLTPVVATGAPRRGLPAEYVSILDACRAPLPVVELAGRTGLAVGVLRVLLGDLRESGLIVVPPPSAPSGIPHEQVLRHLLDALRAL